MRESNGKTKETCGCAPINGLKMYYEIEGTGDPLVYIPPVFGCAGLKSFPALVENHSVITVDLQLRGSPKMDRLCSAELTHQRTD